MGSWQRRIRQPWACKTCAEVRANSGEKNRVSYPITSVGDFVCARTCWATAADARRTPPNVKSSAITPRQPEVPKCIAWFVTDGYCILAPKPQSHNIQNDARRTSKDTAKFHMTDKIVVLVTCGSAEEARKIARALVRQHTAACANILSSPVQSAYRWKGTVETAKEFLLIIKTTKARFPQLKAAVKRLHSYDLPEIIAVPIVSGASDYLNWISDSVRASRGRKK